MKTIFDKDLRIQLIIRIEKVDQNSIAEWGKMNVLQMLKHNTYWNSWILGKENYTYKHAFLGKIFGKSVLKKMIKDDQPFDKNIPTSNQFKVTEVDSDFEEEKAKWISLVGDFENFSNPAFIHDFFGKMTKEEIGVLVYKHTDHHLRQFGV